MPFLHRYQSVSLELFVIFNHSAPVVAVPTLLVVELNVGVFTCRNGEEHVLLGEEVYGLSRGLVICLFHCVRILECETSLLYNLLAVLDVDATLDGLGYTATAEVEYGSVGVDSSVGVGNGRYATVEVEGDGFG